MDNFCQITESLNSYQLISIVGGDSLDYSEQISFFKEDASAQNDDISFVIDVADGMEASLYSLLVDTVNALAFWITVGGIVIQSDADPVNLSHRPIFPIRKGRFILGRMICLLKQQLNL